MKPKICWASVGETFYSYIPKEYFLLDTNYFFSIDEKIQLLGFLNSKLIRYWINQNDTPIGNGGAYRHYKYNLENLHVPDNLLENNELAKLTTQAMVSENEDDLINLHIYNLYKLSTEEIDFIEGKIIED